MGSRANKRSQTKRSTASRDAPLVLALHRVLDDLDNAPHLDAMNGLSPEDVARVANIAESGAPLPDVRELRATAPKAREPNLLDENGELLPTEQLLEIFHPEMAAVFAASRRILYEIIPVKSLLLERCAQFGIGSGWELAFLTRASIDLDHAGQAKLANQALQPGNYKITAVEFYLSCQFLCPRCRGMARQLIMELLAKVEPRHAKKKRPHRVWILDENVFAVDVITWAELRRRLRKKAARTSELVKEKGIEPVWKGWRTYGIRWKDAEDEFGIEKIKS